MYFFHLITFDVFILSETFEKEGFGKPYETGKGPDESGNAVTCIAFIESVINKGTYTQNILDLFPLFSSD